MRRITSCIAAALLLCAFSASAASAKVRSRTITVGQDFSVAGKAQTKSNETHSVRMWTDGDKAYAVLVDDLEAVLADYQVSVHANDQEETSSGVFESTAPLASRCGG